MQQALNQAERIRREMEQLSNRGQGQQQGENGQGQQQGNKGRSRVRVSNRASRVKASRVRRSRAKVSNRGRAKASRVNRAKASRVRDSSPGQGNSPQAGSQSPNGGGYGVNNSPRGAYGGNYAAATTTDHTAPLTSAADPRIGHSAPELLARSGLQRSDARHRPPSQPGHRR